ncbi:hypothetical protein F5X68DRAFT_218886 [Plectosphaerella plurivora]|uniref:Uncharacterized protein n=1 Tax=Plectosphaerella plurivora TaxID=936078 RepID=A0A9P8V0G5_9PEZI|nr:hypothetical protein F5X68DRAFT_218886 [Plectosphaerella plurivora]
MMRLVASPISWVSSGSCSRWLARMETREWAKMGLKSSCATVSSVAGSFWKSLEAGLLPAGASSSSKAGDSWSRLGGLGLAQVIVSSGTKAAFLFRPGVALTAGVPEALFLRVDFAFSGDSAGSAGLGDSLMRLRAAGVAFLGVCWRRGLPRRPGVRAPGVSSSRRGMDVVVVSSRLRFGVGKSRRFASLKSPELSPSSSSEPSASTVTYSLLGFLVLPTSRAKVCLRGDDERAGTDLAVLERALATLRVTREEGTATESKELLRGSGEETVDRASIVLLARVERVTRPGVAIFEQPVGDDRSGGRLVEGSRKVNNLA